MAPGGQRRASIPVSGPSRTAVVDVPVVASGLSRTAVVGGPVVASGLSRTQRLRVLVSDERGRRVSAPGLARWLARVAPARARGTVSVALVSDARVRALNWRYRHLDRPTDVLSFPASARGQSPRATARLAVAPKTRRRPAEANPANPANLANSANLANPANPASPANLANPANPQSPIPNPFLGDIVIARGVARRQARAARHSELTELRVLALHGLLHLLGYDHDRDNGRMRRVERQLRQRGGLPEGLIERARDAAPAAFASAKARAKRAAALSQERRGWGPGAVKKVGPRAGK